jgi:hypothetical protein
MPPIYASKGSKQYKPFQAPEGAPLYNYTVPGHGLNTWAMKDTGGAEWYLTDGGNWRNSATKVLQSQMPSYAQPTPAAPPAAAPPANPPAPPPQPEQWKSIWEFMPKDFAGQMKPQPVTAPQPSQVKAPSYWDSFPKNWTDSPAYKFELDRGNQALDRQLSSMGLLGSGADLEKRQLLIGETGARETARAMQGADQNFGAAQNMAARQFDADTNREMQRYNNEFGSNEALRGQIANLMGQDFSTYIGSQEAGKNRELEKDAQNLGATGMVLDFLKTLNPMQYGFPATNTISENTLGLGKALASLVGSGGGGGGGSAQTPGLPPSAGSNFNSGGYWAGAAGNILGALLPAINKNF